MTQRMGFAVVVSVMALSVLACRVGRLPLNGSSIRGSGNVVEEIREVSDFAGVTLAGSGELIIELGQSESLLIEAEDNLMQYLETEVRHGTLEIGVETGVNLRPTRPLRFTLTVKELDTIVLAGSGSVVAPDLEADRFSVTIAGSGDVELGGLSADKLNVTVSGSGNLDIAGGEVDEQSITISGSGDYGARNLASASATVFIAGSGRATVRASDHLQATVTGSGDINYLGSPTVESTVLGSGDIKQIGE